MNAREEAWNRIAALALVGSLGACDLTHECTEIGCASGTTLSVPVACEAAELSSLELMMCRNEECHEGSFTTLSSFPAPGTGQSVTFPLENRHAASPTVTVTLWNEGASGFRIEFHWMASDARELRNGDVYRATATTASGTTVLDVAQGVTYRESFPNGKDCDEFACKQATIMTSAVSCSESRAISR